MARNRFLRSLSHAITGMRYVWREERNFRIHIAATIAVVIAIVLLQFTALESAVLLLLALLVLSAEIINTILERFLDAIQPEHHEGIGAMKDMMAGVVLLLSIGSVIIGLLVVLHHFAYTSSSL